MRVPEGLLRRREALRRHLVQWQVFIDAIEFDTLQMNVSLCETPVSTYGSLHDRPVLPVGVLQVESSTHIRTQTFVDVPVHAFEQYVPSGQPTLSPLPFCPHDTMH